MSGRMVIALTLALAAQTAAADEARKRDGGSSGGHDRSTVGERHHSSDRSGSAPSSAKASGGSGESSSSAPPLTDAQRRHPRPGTRRAQHYGYPHYRSSYYGSYYPYYHDADYYGPYFDAYYYGGYYGYPRHYRGHRYSYRDTGSIRVLVEPEETRVYVDGYYAGVVDDFDGIFQRLYLSPGRHEIALKLEGHRSHRMKVYVPYNHGIKIHHHMVRGSGEDPPEDLAGTEDGYEGQDRRAGAKQVERLEREEQEEPDQEEPDEDVASRGVPQRGTLRLDVRPHDASVYVDGEFRGTARQAQSLDLPAGTHRLEVVRPGFKTFERDVEIRVGRAEEVDVELDRP